MIWPGSPGDQGDGHALHPVREFVEEALHLAVLGVALGGRDPAEDPPF